MKFGPALTRTVTNDIRLNNVAALIGEAGIGKTSFIKALAIELGTRAFVLSCNQLSDKADLTGLRTVQVGEPEPDDPSGGYRQVFIPHEIVAEAIRYAKEHPDQTPVLMIDEVNRADTNLPSALMAMVTERRLGSIHLPDNLRLVVAMNDKGNITALDEASLSRMVLYRVTPDAHTFRKLMGDDLHPAIAKTLTENPKLVFERPIDPDASFAGDSDDEDSLLTMDDFEAEKMLQITTPRTIEVLNGWLRMMDKQTLSELSATPSDLDDVDNDHTVLREMLEAYTGPTTFTKHVEANLLEMMASQTDDEETEVITIDRPQIMDELEAIDQRSTLSARLSDLDPTLLGEIMTWCLLDTQADHRSIIQAMDDAPVATLSKNNIAKLVDASRNQPINDDALREVGNTHHASLVSVVEMLRFGNE